MTLGLGQNAPGYCQQLRECDEILDGTASGDLPGGVPTIIGGVLCIPKYESATGEPVSYLTRGLWTMPKSAPLTISAGDILYWSTGTLNITKTTSDYMCGICPAGSSAASADTTVTVQLMPELRLAELAAVAVDTTALSTHINLGTGAHAGTAISFTPVGTIAATTVSGAIAEVSGDVTAHLDDTSAAHAASAIAVTPAGTITSTTAAAAINEIDADLTATRGAYMIEFTGLNTTGGTASAVIADNTTVSAPAAGDKVAWIRGFVTTTGVPVAMPVVGTAFAAALVSDTGIKISQLQAAGDLTLNTYYAEIIPVRPTP